MPDYASILRRSISALPDPSAEMREAVYQRARAALARQLTAVDPPLSTREIETQHQELEDAVARLEAEYAPDDEPQEPDFAGIAREDEFFYPAPSAPAPPPKAHPPRDIERDERADFDEEDEDFADEPRRSRAPLLVGAVVVAALVAAGAYVFSDAGSVFGILGGGEREIAAVEPEAEPQPAAPETPDASKRPDRLSNGTASPPAPEPPATAMAEPEAPETLPAEGVDVAPPLPSEAAPGLQGEETAALQQPGASLVEQRAIYYYQGPEGSAGQASEGTATWAEITKDGRPAIQATLRLDKQNVTTTVTIYRNYDTTLPASHLVEIQFSGPLGTEPIQRVPALVLKQTEQARGEPLTGAAVPVTNELFWIALSDDEQNIERNVRLLREGSWFDIPILFNDQTRALLTFEKGIPGDRVFETVMATWTPS